MRYRLFLILIFCSVVGLLYGAPKTDKRLSKKILYVGYSPNREKPVYNQRLVGFYPKDLFYEEIDTRMNEFTSLLQNYFTIVDTVDARYYKQEMSKKYDVTIFDALPEPIVRAEDVYDVKGKFVKTLQPQYLDENYTSPTVFIGHTGGVMRNRLNLNIDWYCLCLGGYAHSADFNHKIFKTPFKTEITREKRAIPEQAKGYINALTLPPQIDMWRVQIGEYRENKRFRVGLVSGGEAFKESPDSEYISGGESLKSIDAAAIARQANFLMWGFATQPSYMTDEAKVVFANCVAYISDFNDQKVIVHKPEFVNTHRNYVDDLVVGLKLGKLSDDYLKRSLPTELYEIYKKDSMACLSYIKANRKYFYGYGTYEHFMVDEDAQTLKIANNSSKLLERAIALLEDKDQKELAERVLKRYTGMEFDSADHWRKWYQENHKSLFFSETAGFLFLSKRGDVNRKNDIVVKEEKPVRLSVEMVKEDGRKFVKITFDVQDGYHIYSMNENPASPFAATKINFENADKLKLKGKMKKPKEIRYDSSMNIDIYKGKCEFIQEFEGDVTTLSVTIVYQCCNATICMEPEEQTIHFIVK